MGRNEAPQRLRITIYGLITSFVGVFAVGFLPGPPRLFLLPLALLVVVAVAQLWLTIRITEGRLRHFSLLAAFAAIGFSAGVVYGTLGMMGFYEINDGAYLTVVIACALGTVGGAVGSLASL